MLVYNYTSMLALYTGAFGAGAAAETRPILTFRSLSWVGTGYLPYQWVVGPLHKERCQKQKTGLCGKNSQTEGGGLTQTHSIFFTAFSNSGAYKMA